MIGFELVGPMLFALSIIVVICLITYLCSPQVIKKIHQRIIKWDVERVLKEVQKSVDKKMQQRDNNRS